MGEAVYIPDGDAAGAAAAMVDHESIKRPPLRPDVNLVGAGLGE